MASGSRVSASTRPELVEERRTIRRSSRLRERPLEIRPGGFGGTPRERRARRSAELLRDPRLAGRLARKQLCRDLLGVGVLSGEQARGPRVRKRACGRGEIVIHRGANDRMHELQRQVRLEDLHSRQRVDSRGCRALVQPRERRGMAQLRSGPQHGDGLRQSARRAGQPREPQHDRAPDRAWPQFAHLSGCGRGRRDPVTLERPK